LFEIAGDLVEDFVRLADDEVIGEGLKDSGWLLA
jgi:hypothetical protein